MASVTIETASGKTYRVDIDAPARQIVPRAIRKIWGHHVYLCVEQGLEFVCVNRNEQRIILAQLLDIKVELAR